MKNTTFGILAWLTILSHSVEAQPYWVVETNLNQKYFTIVKFYNGQHTLLYEQRLDGIFLDLSKRRHKRRLDFMLQNYLLSGSPLSKKEAKRKSSKPF